MIAKKQILIVDDEEEIVHTLVKAIIGRRGQDYVPYVAMDGFEALDLMRKKTLAAVVLDINMRNMDGFEVCRNILTDEKLKTIPIIISSGYINEEDLKKFDGLLIKGFLQKPYSIEDLIQKIDEASLAAKLESRFATCFNCMDGEVQLPVIEWIKTQYSLDYVDMITDSGIVAKLADPAFKMTENLEALDISLELHQASDIFVVAHDDCPGNPVEEETQKRELHSAVARLKELIPTHAVRGLWVSKEGEVTKIVER